MQGEKVSTKKKPLITRSRARQSYQLRSAILFKKMIPNTTGMAYIYALKARTQFLNDRHLQSCGLFFGRCESNCEPLPDGKDGDHQGGRGARVNYERVAHSPPVRFFSFHFLPAPARPNRSPDSLSGNLVKEAWSQVYWPITFSHLYPYPGHYSHYCQNKNTPSSSTLTLPPCGSSTTIT